MASTAVIEGSNADSSQNTSSSEEHLQELGMLKQDEVSCETLEDNPFPQPRTTDFTQKPCHFLRLPAEIRNEIYWDVLEFDMYQRGPLLLGQPPITRVNRQTRDEALALYYRSSELNSRTETSEEWVPFILQVLDAFNGGPSGLLNGSQSTLRFLSALQVTFMTEVLELKIEIDFNNNPAATMELDTEDDFEAVVVGSPDMDWTDAAAVQAACDDAAIKLADDIKRRTTLDEDGDEEDPELVAVSTSADHRAALAALRLIALACPSLRPSVCICDASGIIDKFEDTDGYSTDDEDEYFDEDGYPDTDDEYPDGYDDYLDWIGNGLDDPY